MVHLIDEEIERMKKAETSKDAADKLVTVSYTHLDVYKRQVQVSPSSETSTLFARSSSGVLVVEFHL